MKMRQKFVWAGWVTCWLAMALWPVMAQAENEAELRLRLRYADGAAVVGERVVLERLPAEAPVPPACKTDRNGECVWRVERGLYQVLFSRPLDLVSLLTTGEGGLTGLGVTVGDEDITYHFTFHSDGRVYFDAAPDALRPSPIIPEPEALPGGGQPTPAPNDATATATATQESPAAPDTAVPPTASNIWRILLFSGGGLAVGGGLHVWSRRRQTTRLPDNKTNRLPNQETKNA